MFPSHSKGFAYGPHLSPIPRPAVGNLTHSQSVIAEEAGKAAGAILQGEGLIIGVVGRGLAGVVAGVGDCKRGRT